MNPLLLLLTGVASQAPSALSNETQVPLGWVAAVVFAMLGAAGAFGTAVLGLYRAAKVEPLQVQVTLLEKQVALLTQGQGGLEKSLERVERDIQTSIRELRDNLEERQKAIHDAINKLQATLLDVRRQERKQGRDE